MAPKSTKQPRSSKSAREQPDYVSQIQQLNEQLSTAQASARTAESERNFFQLERDRACQLLECAQRESNQLRNDVQARDRALAEASESHSVSVRVYRQKLKDLMYNNNNSEISQKTRSEQQNRQLENAYRARESELRGEVSALSAQLKSQETAFNDQLRAGKQQAGRQLQLLREEYEGKLWGSVQQFESKLQQALQEAELRRKAECGEVESRKNQQIERLVVQHNGNFAKMKEYYQYITNSNLELIKNLKDELEEMRRKQIANEQLMYEIAQENRRLTAPLQGALGENEQLRKQLEALQKQAEELRKDSQKAGKMEFLNSQMQWENDQLKIALKDTARERDELRARFEAAVADQQQKSAFRLSVLEKRVVSLQQELEAKAATLGEVMAAANLDGAVAQNVAGQMDNVLEAKNRNIRELSFELARVMRLYNEALRVYRGKMTAAGLETADIDAFRPFEVRDDL